jgi:putative oxidoreductase
VGRAGLGKVHELVGGALVLLGLFTRLGAFVLACVMLTAVVGVHWGTFFLPTGFEFALALLGMAIALLIEGGGRASLDERLSGERGRRR